MLGNFNFTEMQKFSPNAHLLKAQRMAWKPHPSCLSGHWLSIEAHNLRTGSGSNTAQLAVRAELVEAHSPFDRLRANELKRTALGQVLAAARTLSAIFSAQFFTRHSSLPSTITRKTGSVPEGRNSTRPLPSRSLSAAVTAS